MSDEEESTQVFSTQVEARRFVEAVVSSMILTELEDPRTRWEGWFLGGVTHEPTQRRILKAAKALAVKLQKASGR